VAEAVGAARAARAVTKDITKRAPLPPENHTVRLQKPIDTP